MNSFIEKETVTEAFDELCDLAVSPSSQDFSLDASYL